jgi:hypothetical protein
VTTITIRGSFLPAVALAWDGAPGDFAAAGFDAFGEGLRDGAVDESGADGLEAAAGDVEAAGKVPARTGAGETATMRQKTTGRKR